MYHVVHALETAMAKDVEKVDIKLTKVSWLLWGYTVMGVSNRKHCSPLAFACKSTVAAMFYSLLRAARSLRLMKWFGFNSSPRWTINSERRELIDTETTKFYFFPKRTNSSVTILNRDKFPLSRPIDLSAELFAFSCTCFIVISAKHGSHASFRNCELCALVAWV